MNDLTRLIKKARVDIKTVANEVDSHIEKYGEKPCDYLTHRLQLLMFHKGELNALIKLES